MAQKNNYLLGYAERLTHKVTVKTGGSPKKPPYTFDEARRRTTTKLATVQADFRALPSSACPNDEAVAVVTLHPRYVSKSDYPDELFRAVGVRPLGSKPRRVAPERWGVSKPPATALGEDVFVAGPRRAFDLWAASVPSWTQNTTGARYLVQLEDVAPFRARDKVRGVQTDTDECMLEVVLHSGRERLVLDAFEAFVERLDAEAFFDRRRDVGALTFLPVLASREDIETLAMFTFVRVARGMPSLRPFRPGLARTDVTVTVDLPDADVHEAGTRAVVFDGGLPAEPDLSRWVTRIEPDGIGPPVPAFEEHGLAVTSSLLFGSLEGGTAPRPLCPIDHVRVLDDQTGAGLDMEYFDVLDRIVQHLDEHEGEYDFANISLGPCLPVEDDDVTAWTAALDERFQHGTALVTVAAGNDGAKDAKSGLNRIQPPADGVNILAVGACDGAGPEWKRASYSCVGPGRCPGVVKPDGVAFGGSHAAPFMVLEAGSSSSAVGTAGTSFAAPLALRSGVSVRVQLGGFLSPLATRALLIHRAEPGGEPRSDVGWGRFEGDPRRMITCDDHEAIAIYQGALPVGEHLRAAVPVPDGQLTGMLTLSATLLIGPEIEPAHPGSYTKSGVEVRFRPHLEKFTKNKDGSFSKHPKTTPFFNEKNMYAAAEYEFREDGHKWEPCLSSSRRFQPSSLKQPCFDIYYHRREAGTVPGTQPPIPYALVVSLTAPKIPDLYNRVLRAHAGVLVPITPRLHVPVTV